MIRKRDSKRRRRGSRSISTLCSSATLKWAETFAEWSNTCFALSKMRLYLVALFVGALLVRGIYAQSTVTAQPPEEKQKQQQTVARAQQNAAREANVVFRGNQAFTADELRTQLKEQLSTITQLGLSAPRADDAAYFLALFYRKHGYSKVDVHYKIDGSGGLLLDVNEGPLVTLGTITFVGNHKETADKLFEYAVGPTRERYSKLQKNLPFVASDVEEGADLIHRLYVAEGFLDSAVSRRNTNTRRMGRR